MKEKWLPIKDFEGRYSVSNLGNVKSLGRVNTKTGNKGSSYTYQVPEKLLSPKVTKLGYLGVGLSDGKRGARKHIFVHRLVAQAFLENPNNLPQVHHKDHNKKNNCVENLQWVTGSENVRAAIVADRFPGGFKRGLEHHIGKLTDEQVAELRSNWRLGYSALAEKYGISKSHAHDILNNKRRVLKTNLNGSSKTI